MSFVRVLVTLLALGQPVVGLADCSVRSGSGTTALVELYTSEGCSSCPPADRLLAGLRQDARLVPLALHVGYWDSLGWRDPFAREDFVRRQHWLARLAGQRTVYTPQFVVDGRAVGGGGVMAAVAALNRQPARADLHLRARPAGDDALAIEVTARSAVAGAVLYVAVAENGLSTQVRAGENAGRRLPHEHVARVWIGPVELDRGGVTWQREVALAKDWRRANLELSALVQDPRDGRILQAVGVGRCLGG